MPYKAGYAARQAARTTALVPLGTNRSGAGPRFFYNQNRTIVLFLSHRGQQHDC